MKQTYLTGSSVRPSSSMPFSQSRRVHLWRVYSQKHVTRCICDRCIHFHTGVVGLISYPFWLVVAQDVPWFWSIFWCIFSYFTFTVQKKRIRRKTIPILLDPVLTVTSDHQTGIEDGDVEVRTSDLMISLRSTLSLRKNLDATRDSVRHLYHQSLTTYLTREEMMETELHFFIYIKYISSLWCRKKIKMSKEIQQVKKTKSFYFKMFVSFLSKPPCLVVDTERDRLAVAHVPEVSCEC